MRLLANGKIDSTFGLNGANTISLPGTIEQVNDAVFQEGRILVAGFSSITDINTKRRLFLARFTENGQIDSTFNNNGVFTPYTNLTPDGTQFLTSEAWCVAVQPDKKIVVGGAYRAYTNSDMLAIRLYPGLTSGLSNDFDRNSLRVYPNPVSDWIQLELKTEGVFRASLYNLAGQLMQSWSVQVDAGRSKPLLLNPQLPRGQYFLSLEKGHERWGANLSKQ